jgi:hypothetical protein
MNQKRFQTLVALSLGWALGGLVNNVSAQGTIFSTLTDQRGYAGSRGFPVVSGWSQSSTLANVSIAANLDGGGGTVSGTAWLTTQIGPGTTIANEIAHCDFSVTSPVFEPELTTLFSGLTLGPGSYYLVLTSSGGGGWEVASSFIPIMASGIGVTSRSGRSFFSVAAYPPATSFFPERASDFTDEYFQYAVTVVPEPGVVTLYLLGCGAIMVSRRRISRHRW